MSYREQIESSKKFMGALINLVQRVHGNTDEPSSDCSSTPHNDLNHSRDDVNPLLKSPLPMYGKLVVLGYNGSLPQGETERRKSKFILFQRAVPNGVRKYKSHVVRNRIASEPVSNRRIHSISYSLKRNQAVVEEYALDGETDMFQIGRSPESPIDCVVVDKIESQESTISRYACRIVIQRSSDFIARVYAAGFDTFRNIFLGEGATKWYNDVEMDGFTTNGVLIMHPRGPFCGGAEPGTWREVSVRGDIYPLRQSRPFHQQKPSKIGKNTNVLQDGTMIDLCGVTLLWRSAEGLSRSHTKHLLEEKIDELNAGRPLCPVRLNTLEIPRKSTRSVNDKHPYVYFTCGHVQSLHEWGQNKESDSRICPVCRQVGPIAKLRMGTETLFYVDCEPPTFSFNPCGHMASEKSVKYWASVKIPTLGFHAACPFCATPLREDPGYVRLIFQDHVDC